MKTKENEIICEMISTFKIISNEFVEIQND